jgi:predicted DsbA family dithiol-disulfide isomerase
MAARLGGLGREVGIEFDLAAARRFDTFDVHRLLAWGRSQPALRADLLDRCFRGALELGEDLGDHAVLVGLVTELGGDAAVAAEVLSGDDFATEVRVDLDAARELGISGVPAFVFDASFVVPGAQDADRLAALIERLRARAAGTR